MIISTIISEINCPINGIEPVIGFMEEDLYNLYLLINELDDEDNSKKTKKLRAQVCKIADVLSTICGKSNNSINKIKKEELASINKNYIRIDKKPVELNKTLIKLVDIRKANTKLK